MSKQEIKKIVNEMQIKNPAQWFKFLELNRKIYNSLCRPCQLLTMRQGGNVKPADYCEKCRPGTIKYLEEIKKLIEGG
jgi:hypothetical protein